MSQVRPFRYRPYRVKARLEIDFCSESEILHGTSRDISADGMRGMLTGRITAGTRGRLVIHTATTTLGLHAIAAYIHHDEVAFTFCFQSNWERDQLAKLVLSLQRAALQRNSSPAPGD